MKKQLTPHEIRQHYNAMPVKQKPPTNEALREQIALIQGAVDALSSQLKTVHDDTQTLLKASAKPKKEEK